MNYKIIIQREDKDGGAELWNRYDENIFNDDEQLVEEVRGMYEILKERDKPVPF